MEIMKRIEEIALRDRIQVSLVELGEKCIKIKAAEGESLPSTFKCSNKPDPTFILANQNLKRYVNIFKNYQLPDEHELTLIFENAVKENMRRNSMTEEDERNLKNEILNRPSIEKLYLYKVELKIEKRDEVEVQFYSLKIIGVNPQTSASEEDELIIYCHNTPAIDPPELKEKYEEFRKALEDYISEGRNHYLAFLKQCEAEREADIRKLVLSASQGNLFSDAGYQLNEYEQRFLDEKAAEYFPEKFRNGRYINSEENSNAVVEYKSFQGFEPEQPKKKAKKAKPSIGEIRGDENGT